MTSQVVVGVVCGFSAGIVVVVAYLIYHYIHHRRDVLRARNKVNDPRLRSRTIIQNEIPNFYIPTTFPIAVQEPYKDYDADREESGDELSALSSPTAKHTVILTPQEPRRGSVQLEQILTSTKQTARPGSPLSTSSSDGLSVTSGRGRLKNRESSGALGQLEFSLYYDQHYKVLQVYVVQAMQVYAPGTGTFPDTNVRVSITANKKKVWEDRTRVVLNTSHPKYNEKLDCQGLTPNKVGTGILKFVVFDATKNIPIGECIYLLSDLPYNLFVTEVAKLSDVDIADEVKKPTRKGSDQGLGQLLVSMSHNPIDKKLTVRVDSGKGLPNISKGTANPYVKVEIWFVGQRMYSRSTKVINKTRSPIFGEIFVFDITDDMLPQITITFRVKHHGRIRDSNIGKIDLGYNAECELEYRHWEQVLDKPHLEIDQWHYVRKYIGD